MRVATVPFQQTMRTAMQAAQQQLTITQQRIATNKKANTYAELGTDAVRNLSTHSLLANQQAQAKTARELETTLSLYDANIGAVDTMAQDLRTSILGAIGNGKSGGLQQTVESAFAQFRSALNASSDGKALFGGAQTDATPFLPETLADTAGATTASAFANDETRASTRVGDDIDVTFGVTATDIGADLLAAFRTLAEAGPIGDSLTAAQSAALKTAVEQLDTALPKVRSVAASNGAKQAQGETLAVRADDRAVLLEKLISESEDADYGQLSIDLALQKQQLEASYSVFTQISAMSLANYLK